MIRTLGGEFRLGKDAWPRLHAGGTAARFRRGFSRGWRARLTRLGLSGEELFAAERLSFLRKITDGQPLAVGSGCDHCGRRQHSDGHQPLRFAAGRELGARALSPDAPRDAVPHGGSGAAEAEGVKSRISRRPGATGTEEREAESDVQRMELGPPDKSGRASPVPIPGSEFEVQATCVIAAIGQAVDFNARPRRRTRFSKWGIAVDGRTLATNLPGVFAGGDAVTGPDLAVRAVAAGKLAAASIDQFLSGKKVIGAPEAVNVFMGKLNEEELAAFLRGIEKVAARTHAASARRTSDGPRSRKSSWASRSSKRWASRGAAWAAGLRAR